MTKAEADGIAKKLKRFGKPFIIYPAPMKGGIEQYEIRIGTQSEFVFRDAMAASAMLLALAIERRA